MGVPGLQTRPPHEPHCESRDARKCKQENQFPDPPHQQISYTIDFADGGVSGYPAVSRVTQPFWDSNPLTLVLALSPTIKAKSIRLHLELWGARHQRTYVLTPQIIQTRCRMRTQPLGPQAPPSPQWLPGRGMRGSEELSQWYETKPHLVK